MKTSIPILLLAILFCIFIPNKGEPRKGFLEPPGIVIVDVQDRDLAAFGRWPWPRETHGRALDALNRQGAVGVYFDYVFSEEDTRWPQKDQALSDAIKKSRIPVFLPYFFILEGGKEAFPYPVPWVNVEGRSRLRKVDMQVLPCLPLFAEKAAAIGYINHFPDEKHVLRELHLLLEWNTCQDHGCQSLGHHDRGDGHIKLGI